MKSIVWFGALLALLGILGLTVPVFTTTETKDIVKLGELKIQNTERSMHVVPLPLSAGTLVLGISDGRRTLPKGLTSVDPDSIVATIDPWKDPHAWTGGHLST